MYLVKATRGRPPPTNTQQEQTQPRKKGDNLVKVITIRDDVYAGLYKIKRAKGFSFSEAIDYLLELEQQRKGKKTDMFALSGSVSRDDVDKRLLDRMRRGF